MEEKNTNTSCLKKFQFKKCAPWPKIQKMTKPSISGKNLARNAKIFGNQNDFPAEDKKRPGSKKKTPERQKTLKFYQIQKLHKKKRTKKPFAFLLPPGQTPAILIKKPPHIFLSSPARPCLSLWQQPAMKPRQTGTRSLTLWTRQLRKAAAVAWGGSGVQRRG